MQATSFVDVLRSLALARPHERAFTFARGVDGEEEVLTYISLDGRVRAVAAMLQEHHLSGERVVLLYPPGPDYLVALLACMYAGCVSVPLYPPRNNASLDRVIAVANCADAKAVLAATGILTMAERIAPSLARPGMLWLSTDATNESADVLAESWVELRPSADALAVLQFTSGSTGDPKGVMLCHGNLLANSALISRAMGLGPGDCGVMWVPPYHDMGLIGSILQPLYAGFPTYLLPATTFIQKPLRWLQAISSQRATVSGGPNFAYDLCVDRINTEKLDGLDLSTWRVAIDGAEPVRAATLNRFAERFARCGFRASAFFPCYGLAEATLYVTGHKRGTGPDVLNVSATALQANTVDVICDGDNATPLVSSGYPAHGTEVRIVDPKSGLPAQDGEIGEIWLRGESIAMGYWRNAQETALAFGAYIQGEARSGPYLRTGDLGFCSEGRLFVTGRIKDLIIIRGKNHYPQDIELTVTQSHDALQQGGAAAFVFDDGVTLGIVAEVRRGCCADRSDMEAAIARAVSLGHGLVVGRLALIRPGSLAKTSSGKVRRVLCRSQMQDGTLDRFQQREMDDIA